MYNTTTTYMTIFTYKFLNNIKLRYYHAIEVFKQNFNCFYQSSQAVFGS